MYKKLIMAWLCLFLFTANSLWAAEEDDDEEAQQANLFGGVVNFIPGGKVGEWIVEGRSFWISDQVRLEQSTFPVAEENCVILFFKDGEVEEIEGLGTRTHPYCRQP